MSLGEIVTTPITLPETRSVVDDQDLLLTCGQMLLSGIASSVLVLRPSGQIAFANKAAEVMIGRTTADLAGLQLSSLFKDDVPSSQPASHTGIGTKRGRLSIRGDAQLPVRIDIRPVQTGSNGPQGSVVTIEDLSDLLQMDEYVKQMQQCDTLTGLPKEETLTSVVEAALMQLHTTGQSFALLELNVDQFRRIRESLGHDAAADALREIAARLIKTIRKGDVVTRSNTDAFTILLTSCTSREDALTRADAVLGAFKEPFRFGLYCTNVTASIGMSFAQPGIVAASTLFTEAELAIRRCKALGGNRVVCFEPTMADWRSHAVQIESQMQSALSKEEFYVLYQPQVCCQTGRLVGVESLLRWQSPLNGLVMPSTFIPAAEESGLIVQLGEWCLRTACNEMVSLQQQLGYPIRLAVNVSPKQIHSPGFKEFVRRTLEETGLCPELLELEITEGLLISHEEEALKAIHTIQELGVSIAMDDFGMGFSNLSYINRFKIDRLKIDRSFISRCPDDHSSRMITTSLVLLAKSLGIEVVAEGVETQAQAALLAGLQCDLAQGYLYSRPTTIAEIRAMASKTSLPRVHVDAEAGTSASSVPVEAQTLAAPQPDSPLTVATLIDSPRAPDTAATAALETPAPGVSESAPKVAVESPASRDILCPAPAAEAASDTAAAPPASSVMPAVLESGETHSEDRQGAAPGRRDSIFITHTILVPPSAEGVQFSSVALGKPEERNGRSRRRPVTAVVTGLEPLDPVCRPKRPQRLAGATRIRWTAVPEEEAV